MIVLALSTTAIIVGSLGILALILVIYLTRDFWYPLIYWIRYHEYPYQAAIERWALQISERANLNIDGERDVYRPTLYNLVLQDKQSPETSDVVIYSTTDLENMDKAHYTVKRDLEQSRVYEFHTKWINNPDFSYLSFTHEQRQEFFKSGGK